MKVRYYKIRPDVAGHLSAESILNPTKRPIEVKYAHYVFDGWFGDDILVSIGLHIVSESLYKELRSNKLSGVEFEKCKVSKSDEFKILFPNTKLPKFYWLKISGKPYESDCWTDVEDKRLVISPTVLNILKKFSIQNCDIKLLNV